MANKDFTIVRECKNSSYLETLTGGVVVGCFVFLWIASLLFPILLGLSVYYKNQIVTAILVAIAVIAYLPWEKGFLSRSLTAVVDYYHPRYYKSCQTFLANGSLPSKNPNSTFYAIHPHGAFCFGWSTLFHSTFMENTRFCFSPALHASPIFRLWCRMTGNPGKADKGSMISYMKAGMNIALPPGGFEEATLTSLNQDRVYIKKRAGFIKLCLQHGYKVVPVYCFGERSTYWNLQGAWKLRLALNGMGIPAIVIWGLPLLPLLPRRTHIAVVAGEPLVLPKIASPSRDDVKKYHDQYMAALTKIFEDHKANAYGEEYAKTAKLELW